MQSRWAATQMYTSMLWWLYLWAVGVFAAIASVRGDARLFGIDFTGFFLFNGIGLLVYVVVVDILPPFWWLFALPWRLRSRPLAAAFVVTVIALWLALLLVVIPRYYGPSGQLVGASVSVVGVIALYRFARYRQRKQRLIGVDATSQ